LVFSLSSHSFSILSTSLLQNPSFFDADGEKTWVWNCNGELAPYDVDDDVFFLVKQLLRAVRLLRFQPLAQVCSVDFERVSSVSQIMNIHASMEFDGLGPRRCFPFCHLQQFAYHSVTVFFSEKMSKFVAFFFSFLHLLKVVAAG
jgi:hypothetical protein